MQYFTYFCLQLFLGCIPEEQDQWVSAITSNRENYYSLKKKVNNFVNYAHKAGFTCSRALIWYEYTRVRMLYVAC